MRAPYGIVFFPEYINDPSDDTIQSAKVSIELYPDYAKKYITGTVVRGAFQQSAFENIRYWSYGCGICLLLVLLSSRPHKQSSTIEI